MANGSHKRGPALADRVREDGERHARWLQRAVDEEREAAAQLPRYSEDSDSEITANRQGIHVRSRFPRIARIAIGFGLGFLFLSIGIAIVLHFAK